ncbi:MAG TPA: type II toxin-antitoxin system PemK/MazF family toxin [Treponemataceae bacterium]|nr:type II toxin-antitoxin system PemK/MazF family toxin [Treponemataceae bacterium]
MTRGEIWWVDLGIPFGSEPGFNRPALVIQADAINISKINTTIVIPFTTNLSLADAPGNVFVSKEESRLSKDSVLVVSQLSVIDKNRLIKYEHSLSQKSFEEVEDGIRLILDIC